jgi:hypothetical protein
MPSIASAPTARRGGGSAMPAIATIASAESPNADGGSAENLVRNLPTVGA